MKIIKTDELLSLINNLGKEMDIWAPVGDSFERVPSLKTVEIPQGTTHFSAKEIFFPKEQTLLTYKREDGNFELDSVPLPDAKGVIFGLRSCDLVAIAEMDEFFTGRTYTDVYYQKLREGMLLFGVACKQAAPTCFCNWFDQDVPVNPGVADVYLYPLEDYFLATSTTERGEKMLSSFPDADEESLEKLERFKLESIASLPEKQEIDGLADRMYELFDDKEFWRGTFDRCLGCGICTFVCPTCHCFDIQEEIINRVGRRYRLWDSCQFSLFTLEASGLNPRPTRFERMRQRFMDKLSYSYKEFGRYQCVGCGRCVVMCPANIDIREVIAKSCAVSRGVG